MLGCPVARTSWSRPATWLRNVCSRSPLALVRWKSSRLLAERLVRRAAEFAGLGEIDEQIAKIPALDADPGGNLVDDDTQHLLAVAKGFCRPRQRGLRLFEPAELRRERAKQHDETDDDAQGADGDEGGLSVPMGEGRVSEMVTSTTIG